MPFNKGSSTLSTAASPVAESATVGRAKFRNEVLAQRSNQWLGKTSLAVPISFWIYASAALSLAALIVAFLAFGSFSQTETGSGVISPEGGVTKVLTTASGEITEVLVREGDQVSAGASLFRVRILQKKPAENEAVVAATNIPTDLFEVIKAPVNGRVYTLAKRTGDVIHSYNTEPVATIAADAALVVEVAVSAAVQARTRTGRTVQLELDMFKGRPQGSLHAQVIAVSAESTEAFDFKSGGTTRSYKVVLRIDAEALSFPRDELLGKTAQVKFVLEKRRLYQWLLDPLQTLFGSQTI